MSWWICENDFAFQVQKFGVFFVIGFSLPVITLWSLAESFLDRVGRNTTGVNTEVNIRWFSHIIQVSFCGYINYSNAKWKTTVIFKLKDLWFLHFHVFSKWGIVKKRNTRVLSQCFIFLYFIFKLQSSKNTLMQALFCELQLFENFILNENNLVLFVEMLYISSL